MRIEGMGASIRNTAAAIPAQVDGTAKVIQPENRPAPYQNETEQPVGHKVSEGFIKMAVDKANDTMIAHGRSLEFRIHEKTNEIIVKIIDTDTKEVIREIPSEKMLDMFVDMLELAGLLVDERR